MQTGMLEVKMSLQVMAVTLVLYFSQAECVNTDTPISVMRAIKCVIPNGLEHLTRAALFQQCLSQNYGQGNETRCYPELGCFPMDAPWTSLLRPFPSPLHPAEINVTIYCFSRESNDRVDVQLWPEMSLNGCSFSNKRKTLFLIHGFASNGKGPGITKSKDLYLKRIDANVFAVDWERGAGLLNYLQVASNTRVVGAEAARFVEYLVNHYGLNAQDVHLVGHSLGAHIGAYIAKSTKENINMTIGRITALEGAQPGFEGSDSRVRLDKSDATFVDAIHTNGLPTFPTLGFGLIQPVGHVDFYMNGGLFHPGCVIPNDIPKINSISDLAKFPVELLKKWVFCSHNRAHHFFTQTLDPSCEIWARKTSLPRRILSGGSFGFSEPIIAKVTSKCKADTCLPLSPDTPYFSGRGVFAASTALFSPYCDDPATVARFKKEIIESSSSTLIPNITNTLTPRNKLTSKDIVDGGSFGFSEPIIAKVTSKCKADTCLPLSPDTPYFSGRGVFAASTAIFSPYCDDPATVARFKKEIIESSSSTLIPNITNTLTPGNILTSKDIVE